MSRSLKPCIVALDPGINVGGAVWTRADVRARGFRPPLKTFEIRDPANGKLDWIGRLCVVSARLRNQFRILKKQGFVVEVAHIEIPDFVKGDTVKLACLVGVCAAVCEERGMAVHVVGVNEWKGQLPKKLTNARIDEFFGFDYCSSLGEHAADAVGLGLFVQGASFGD